MSDKDPFVAMSKFKEATHLACVVKTLLEMQKENSKNFYVADFEF